MSDEQNNGSAEIKTPLGSLSFSGKSMSNFIAILSLVVLALIGYAMWEHKGDTKSKDDALLETLQEMVQAQREQNCLIALPQNDRERNSEFCKRVSR